ncbi:kit ligand a [Denticeps clupeoides]|uniref:Kit ligand n=1 Tax=Denticeps clupeoides TaxID=299321 RepID=A0AAY4CIS0_9TELE|nr:kit ligand [Denticeps clupeoides]
MKKSKIWIRTCVHLLLYISVAAYSSKIGNPITDDIKKISVLKQNIPKDYKITIKYIPKDESGMCWVKLNVFHLEESLKDLANKFGNISSNKENINTFIQILLEMRYHIGNSLDDTMLEFECHYREEEWATLHYFKFVEEFFETANSSREEGDCEPPPCPTVTNTTNTTKMQYPSTGISSESQDTQPLLSENVKRSLFSLLLIPLVAIVLGFMWKVRTRSNTPPTERNTGDPALITGVEASAPPLDNQISEEKKRLSMIEAV